MGILPYSYIFILIGIFFEGFTQGLINITTFIELTNVGKKIFPHNKRLQLDIPASVFNLSFYIGDLFEPVLGSWITTNYYFKSVLILLALYPYVMAFYLEFILIKKLICLKLTKKI